MKRSSAAHVESSHRQAAPHLPHSLAACVDSWLLPCSFPYPSTLTRSLAARAHILNKHPTRKAFHAIPTRSCLLQLGLLLHKLLKPNSLATTSPQHRAPPITTNLTLAESACACASICCESPSRQPHFPCLGHRRRLPAAMRHLPPCAHSPGAFTCTCCTSCSMLQQRALPAHNTPVLLSCRHALVKRERCKRACRVTAAAASCCPSPFAPWAFRAPATQAL